jgi:hypothetical protein
MLPILPGEDLACSRLDLNLFLAGDRISGLLSPFSIGSLAS